MKTKAELQEQLLQERVAATKLQRKKLQLEIKGLERDETEADSSSEARREYMFTGRVNEDNYRWMLEEVAGWADYSDDPITIIFNSPGGSVIHGLAVYDFIRSISNRGIPITTVGLGEVASMGGILLQAGDKRLITPNTVFLIHEISSASFGKTSEQKEWLKFTEKLQERCVSILAERSVLSKQQIKARWKRMDWWLFSDEVLELGFADGLAS